MKTKKLLLAMALTGIVSANASANFIDLNNWTLDVTGIDGIATGSVANGVASPISYMAFDNTFHTVISNSIAGTITAGDTFNVKANGVITGMFDNTSSIISPDFFNGANNKTDRWELTFVFDINGVFSTSADSIGNANFDHTSGTLTFYVDNLANGGKASTATSTASVKDGVEIAKFSVINDVLNNNFGGVFNAFLGNGGDKSQFSLLDNPLNAFKDADGKALVPGATLAFTNSDFQSNVQGSGPFKYNPSAFTCGKKLNDFCGTESGQFRIAQVPEPSNLALLSVGLLSLGMTIRRRQAS